MIRPTTNSPSFAGMESIGFTANSLLKLVWAFLLMTAAIRANAQIHVVQVGVGDSPKVAHVGDVVVATGTFWNIDPVGDNWIVTNVYDVIFATGAPAGCSPVTNVITIPGVSTFL